MSQCGWFLTRLFQQWKPRHDEPRSADQGLAAPPPEEKLARLGANTCPALYPCGFRSCPKSARIMEPSSTVWANGTPKSRQLLPDVCIYIYISLSSYMPWVRVWSRKAITLIQTNLQFNIHTKPAYLLWLVPSPLACLSQRLAKASGLEGCRAALHAKHLANPTCSACKEWILTDSARSIRAFDSWEKMGFLGTSQD